MIQRCSKCSKEFTRKKIIKSIFFSWDYKPVICDKCSTKHYINTKTKLTISLGIVVPVFLISFFADGINIFNIPIMVYYPLIYILWSALLIAMTPFFARYSIK